MTIVFKGAAPGSYWQVNDARLTGFTTGHNYPQGPAEIVRHISTQNSPNSAYLSFSASFAIAYGFACMGGVAGPPTQANPGYVYEVDLVGQAPIDPIASVSGNVPFPQIAMALPLPYHHNGDRDFALGVAGSALHKPSLSRPPRQAVTPHFPMNPTCRAEFVALLFALRDSEVLALGPVPATCIRRVFHIF